MKVLCILAWIGVFGGCCLAGVIILGGMSTAQSAPQEAVVICLALACAIIPYCFARGMTELYKIDQVSNAVKELKREVPIMPSALPVEKTVTVKPTITPKKQYNHESLSILD